jgi:hypothetical protein
MKPYAPSFKEGDRVRIANRKTLEAFRRSWKYHHPLQPEQLAQAEVEATIRSIGIYHGGDVIYELEEVAGIWHEDCLQRPEGGA